MPFELDPFAHIGLDDTTLNTLLAEHARSRRPALERLWRYYRNPADTTHLDRPGHPRIRQAQEQGLPPRLIGSRDLHHDDRPAQREIVIENDIAWRVQAMVDFMFGKPVRLRSTARDQATRDAVELALDAIWERSGGIALLQDAALLGHVYGWVDLVVRTTHLANASAPPAGGTGPGGGRSAGATHRSALARTPGPAPAHPIHHLAADAVRFDLVEPTRGFPILDPADYRRVLAYVLTDSRAPIPSTNQRHHHRLVEILGHGWRQLYHDHRLVDEEPIGPWAAGLAPVVHIQNISLPFRYEGLSEVEPLIPLQDELNTRLSDRACRVTLQCFKMYLAKGLDGFDRVPIGPGRIWSTDNPDASITAFGGDADSPSEDNHIREIREALDKASGIPPLASGIVQGRVGSLSSANALRITLMGVLAKTARKRVTYGRGIAQASALALAALDEIGLLRTDPADRGVRLEWPDPLPTDLREETAAARLKAELGVPVERVLESLGESAADPGIT